MLFIALCLSNAETIELLHFTRKCCLESLFGFTALSRTCHSLRPKAPLFNTKKLLPQLFFGWYATLAVLVIAVVILHRSQIWILLL